MQSSGTARLKWMGRVALLLNLSFVAACDEGDSRRAVTEGVSSPDAGATGVVGAAPTWHEHIAPLLSQKCSTCHKQDGLAPFSVQSYAHAKAFAKAMANAVEAGRMPPFLAQETPDCTPKRKYAEDTRLSADEKKMLRAWADADAPEGDPGKAAPLVAPPSSTLAREDAVIRLPQPIVVEKNARGDIHTCVIIDPKLPSDVYVAGRQVISGNDKVLHHLVSYALQPQKAADRSPLTKEQMGEALRTTKGVGIGERYDCFGGPGLQETGISNEMLGAWSPGARPKVGPKDSGQPLLKDALIVLDVHYHPIATPQTDSETRLQLMFTDQRPSLIARPILLGNFVQKVDTMAGAAELLKQPDEAEPKFMIPAGAKDHIEEMTWTWKLPNSPLRVFYSGTHMHYVGRDMSLKLENRTPQPGEDATECLVHTPAWDFNWQGGYGYEATYEELPQMNDGDVLRIRCRFDNTLDNRFLATALEEQGLSAPIDVKLGEDTLDEMCLGSIGIAYPNTQSW